MAAGVDTLSCAACWASIPPIALFKKKGGGGTSFECIATAVLNHWRNENITYHASAQRRSLSKTGLSSR
jgi:hypothetical protein